MNSRWREQQLQKPLFGNVEQLTYLCWESLSSLEINFYRYIYRLVKKQGFKSDGTELKRTSLITLMDCTVFIVLRCHLWLLYSETQVSGCLGMSGGISPRYAQNPLSGERRKTLSITYHALSPPPSNHHLYIIHLINWLQRFYRIIMSLKRSFVPKSDVKQWFTTTTTYMTISAEKWRKAIIYYCYYHCIFLDAG